MQCPPYPLSEAGEGSVTYFFLMYVFKCPAELFVGRTGLLRMWVFVYLYLWDPYCYTAQELTLLDLKDYAGCVTAQDIVVIFSGFLFLLLFLIAVCFVQ